MKSLRVVEGCCHAPSCYTLHKTIISLHTHDIVHILISRKKVKEKKRVGGSKRKKDEPEKDKTAEKSRRLRAGEIRIEGGERRVEGGKEE